MQKAPHFLKILPELRRKIAPPGRKRKTVRHECRTSGKENNAWRPAGKGRRVFQFRPARPVCAGVHRLRRLSARRAGLGKRAGAPPPHRAAAGDVCAVRHGGGSVARRLHPFALLPFTGWRLEIRLGAESAASADKFFAPDFHDSAWTNIAVPSNWETKGFGTPIYLASGYPFKIDPPRVTDPPPTNWTAFAQRDPAGSYRKFFTLPANWSGRRVFIHFDGVDSAFYLWVNGARVGFSKGSRTPAE